MILLTDVNLWQNYINNNKIAIACQVWMPASGFSVTEQASLYKAKVVMWLCGESPIYLSCADCMLTSAISMHSLVELITLSRIMNKLCSKVVEGDISY